MRLRVPPSACTAVCDGKAYVFGGRDSAGTYLNDLWTYDAATDQWISLGKTPLKARVNAAMAATDEAIYVGLGYSAKHAYNNKAYRRDWWRYTPADGKWQQLADFPTSRTVAPTTFTLDGLIYAIYGFGYGFSDDICIYDPHADKWTMHAADPESARSNVGGSGALCNGQLYFGGGYDTHNLTQWYVVDVAADRWTPRRDIPGKGRELAACTATNEYVYLFGGRYFGGDMTGGEVFDTWLRYEPAKDEWVYCGTMPCGHAENQVAFTINGKAYFGLGENENGEIINNLYRIE